MPSLVHLDVASSKGREGCGICLAIKGESTGCRVPLELRGWTGSIFKRTGFITFRVHRVYQDRAPGLGPREYIHR